jgi:hypothetical protein
VPCGSSAASASISRSIWRQWQNLTIFSAPRLLGADGGLQRRLPAILADQLLRIVKAAAAGDEEIVHAPH